MPDLEIYCGEIREQALAIDVWPAPWSALLWIYCGKKRVLTPLLRMNSVNKLHTMLDAIQNAGVPETFNKDFLVDLGFTSSYDTALIKVLRYLGMLDSSNKPQDSYKQFVDHTKAKKVLASRIRAAFDDLYLADKNAHTKQSNQLKGWFKTKTGNGDAVAMKIASTFKSLADYADFSGSEPIAPSTNGGTQDLPPAPEIPPIVPPRNADIKKEKGVSTL